MSAVEEMVEFDQAAFFSEVDLLQNIVEFVIFIDVFEQSCVSRSSTLFGFQGFSQHLAVVGGVLDRGGILFGDGDTTEVDNGFADLAGMEGGLVGFAFKEGLEVQAMESFDIRGIVRIHRFGAFFPSQDLVEFFDQYGAIFLCFVHEVNLSLFQFVGDEQPPDV